MNNLLKNGSSELLVKILCKNNCFKPSLTKLPVSLSQCQLRYKTTLKKEGDEEDDLDKPIKFTTSKAAEWKAKNTFRGTIPEDQPSIQAFSVLFSTAVFMLYFCVFREENDLDEVLGSTLWERIPGLERQQLDLVYEYNKEHGIDNAAIKARIEVLEEKDKVKKN